MRRSSPEEPGITRRRRGRGFSHHLPSGELVDPETLERVRSLAIPPAWQQVWVCTDPEAHLQATGVDDAGRTQYLYHQRWREQRDREKFDRVLDLAPALPDPSHHPPDASRPPTRSPSGEPQTGSASRPPVMPTGIPNRTPLDHTTPTPPRPSS